jgi:hypothetical protein
VGLQFFIIFFLNIFEANTEENNIGENQLLGYHLPASVYQIS